MKMTNWNLLILAAVAIVSTIAAGVLYLPRKVDDSGFEKDSLLIQGLDLAKIAAITLRSGDRSFTLQRQGDAFTVVDRDHYPADTEKVNNLIIKCLDIRCVDRVSTSPDSHPELGVSVEHSDATVVEFFDKDGSSLVGLVLGSTAERGGGVYVRLLARDAVYASREMVFISKGPTDYINTRLVEVDEATIKSVTVRSADETYRLSMDESGPLRLDPIPEGKQVKQTELNLVYRALTSSLNFTDVHVATAVDVEWTHSYTCQLTSHLTYLIQLGDRNDKVYARVQAQGPSRELLQKSVQIRQDEAQEELAKKDAVLQAAASAQKFNDQHAGWVYEVPSFMVARLRKPLAELVEAPSESTEPDEISASHILIGYEGAERSKATRTKEAAKELIESILTMVKEPAADFAALASEYSECSSQADGGDLGAFSQSDMHENFGKAAWKLAPGQVSDLVETPFGFHIIKRTE